MNEVRLKTLLVDILNAILDAPDQKEPPEQMIGESVPAPEDVSLMPQAGRSPFQGPLAAPPATERRSASIFDPIGEKATETEEIEEFPRTRAEAHLRGLKYYGTQKPCRHGHIGLRMTRNAKCLTCIKLENMHFFADGTRPKRKRRFPIQEDEARRLRLEAMQRGDLRYDPQQSCIRGHMATRYVSTNGCTECHMMFKKGRPQRRRQNLEMLALRKG